MTSVKLIQGNVFKDERGGLKFFNSFQMSEIKRFYEISPADTSTIRAWQGHKEEKKWFYCNSGAFVVNLIKIDNFEKPSPELKADKYELSAEKPLILEISGGFASGIKATEKNSRLLVFSNFTLEESREDEFRYSPQTWKASW
jgi:dTDP-4-dehydrorhamnose 3,5-epimerase